MKPARKFLFALFALATSVELLAAAGKGGPPPISPRFQQVRDRIDALFHNRNEPPPPPDARTNPFRAPGSGLPAPVISAEPGTVPDASATSTEPGSDLALLQQAVALLKVGGTINRGDVQQLSINSKPYKEGDVVQVQVQGQTVYLRVKQITRYGVTLTLNASEITLKH
jgi:hypothetical protein